MLIVRAVPSRIQNAVEMTHNPVRRIHGCTTTATTVQGIIFVDFNCSRRGNANTVESSRVGSSLEVMEVSHQTRLEKSIPTSTSKSLVVRAEVTGAASAFAPTEKKTAPMKTQYVHPTVMGDQRIKRLQTFIPFFITKSPLITAFNYLLHY
jgi:hypothetical protein